MTSPQDKNDIAQQAAQVELIYQQRLSELNILKKAQTTKICEIVRKYENEKITELKNSLDKYKMPALTEQSKPEILNKNIETAKPLETIAIETPQALGALKKQRSLELQKKSQEIIGAGNKSLENSLQSIGVNPKEIEAARNELSETNAKIELNGQEGSSQIEQIGNSTETKLEKPVRSKEKANQLINNMLNKLYDKNVTDEQFSELYGVSREEGMANLSDMLKSREQNQLGREVMQYNPKVEVHNAEKGIYCINLPNGEKLFGSVYAILDANEKLGEMSPLARTIQSGQESSAQSVMGISVQEGEGYKSLIVASGSFAQREVNPFPADMDFSEHLNIQAEDKTLAAEKLVSLISETVMKSDSDQNLQFLELKCGSYPDNYPPQLRGKSIKWNKEEISSGQKEVVNPETGEKTTISLQQAAENPSMIKIDWLAMQDNQLKELTKVINVNAGNKNNGETFFDNRLDVSAFQEIYFDDTSEFGLTEKLRDPAVMNDYTNRMKGEITKYSGPGHENYLKVAKRTYNLLKSRGDFEGARSLADLFSTSTSELAAKAESLDLFSQYIENPGKFEPSKLAGQFENMIPFLQENNDLANSPEKNGVEAKVTQIRQLLSQADPPTAQISQLTAEIVPILKNIVNAQVKNIVEQNPSFQQIVKEMHSHGTESR